MKSEPDVWSINQQKKAGQKGVAWDGVRNYQAANNLKKMEVGDLCFFYFSSFFLRSNSLFRLSTFNFFSLFPLFLFSHNFSL